jgi:hypothetical protein
VAKPSEPHPGLKCEECGALIFLDVVTRDEVFARCQRLPCPFYRKGVPAAPDWFDRARWFHLKQRDEAADRAATANEPIPE